jgi:hypothetical protein
MKRRTGQLDTPCLLYASNVKLFQYQNAAVEVERGYYPGMKEAYGSKAEAY